MRKRLHQLELAQPDLNEGWENELQTAMKVIGKEMDKVKNNINSNFMK